MPPASSSAAPSRQASPPPPRRSSRAPRASTGWHWCARRRRSGATPRPTSSPASSTGTPAWWTASWTARRRRWPGGDDMGMWVGRGRKARAAYGFDDIALVPGSLTVNPNEVDISWELCGHRYALPIIAAAMDGVVGPKLATEMGRHGGLAVLNLEGIFSRYANPDDVLDRIVSASQEEATKIIQSIYSEPIKEELIHQRIRAINNGGGPPVGSPIPQRAQRFGQIAQEAGADIFVVQSTVTTARHIATEYTPVDLRTLKKQLAIRLVIGNVVTYEACLELMDVGADALLIGVGPGAACTSREVLGLGVPQVTATADAAAARDLYWKQKGRYVPIITDGGMTTGGDVCKALAA